MLNFHFWIFLEKFPLPKGQTQSIFKITPLLSILAVIANSECVHIVHYGHILVQPAQKQGWPSNNLDLKIQNDAIFEIFMILKIQWLFNELEVKKKILYYIFDKKLTTFAKGRVQKKLVENSTKRGEGGSAPDFPLRKKTKKKTWV